jgi:hypothetical protein
VRIEGEVLAVLEAAGGEHDWHVCIIAFGSTGGSRHR